MDFLTRMMETSNSIIKQLKSMVKSSQSLM
nr:MAG TPA: hypothetical protein [Caudoviricetes sp.]